MIRAVTARLLLGFASGLLLLGACERPPEVEPGPQYEAFTTRPVLAEWEAETVDQALPSLDQDRVEEVRDLLDAIGAGGRLAHAATGQLQDMDARERTAALLGVVEDLRVELDHKRAAYAWLRDTGSPGLLPRLTLRLPRGGTR